MLISPLSIAPMIDWTYSQFRVFMRLLAPKALLYTEMQTPYAILHNEDKALSYHALEHPLALQLGGSDPKLLSQCAKIAQERGYAEINYNLGCPSDRVQAGRFGACLMGEPELALENFMAMKESVRIPVTAKTRIGIDHQDSYEFFQDFVTRLNNAGCDKLIVHARKAWLHGLNPKQNRTLPPLHYDYVYRIKREFNPLPVVINGQILTPNDIQHHLQYVDGVMLGRLACNNPYLLVEIHKILYPESEVLTRTQALKYYLQFMQEQFESNVPYSILLKPILNLAHGLPGAKRWKGKLIHAQLEKTTCRLSESISMLEEMEALVDVPQDYN